jgi:hypothetical protein
VSDTAPGTSIQLWLLKPPVSTKGLCHVSEAIPGRFLPALCPVLPAVA